VGKRLDYIKGESARVDTQLKTLQERAAARQNEIMRLQQRAAGPVAG
jgi:hypothetical protein